MFTKATMPSTVLGACDKTEKSPLPLCNLHYDEGSYQKNIKNNKKFQNIIKSSSLYETEK